MSYKKSIFILLLTVTAVLFIGYVTTLLVVMEIPSSKYIDLIVISGVFILLLFSSFHYLFVPFRQAIEAVENGITAFRDNDFSLTIYNQKYRETDALITLYNNLSDTLRAERNAINQQQLMLDNIIQRTPIALFLTQENGVIAYSNKAAQQLLKISKPINGENFHHLKSGLPESLITTIEHGEGGVVTVEMGDHTVTFNVECSEFILQGKRHHLYSYHDISRQMSIMERDMWKQVIRLISHELNNSLAPISSLTRSAQKIIEQPEHSHLLQEVLQTVGERALHLHQFIEQYATFTRLPEPQLEIVELTHFVRQIETLTEIQGQLNVVTNTVCFDPRQMEQVLINLIKNAKESGSALAEIDFIVEQNANQLIFRVNDRGTGLTEQQRQQVLLPFFTTKPSGSGIGLALCNEIVRNHKGQLRLVNRDGGGLSVSFQLILTKQQGNR